MSRSKRLSRRWMAGAGIVAILGLGAGVASCAAPPPPAAGSFALETFFDGTSRSRGTVRTAGVFTEDFTAGFEGRRDGDRLRLDERFAFTDGDRLQRWDLRHVSPQRYEGTVETELGDGTMGPPVPVEGYTTPRGAVLRYIGQAPGGGRTALGFRHWMERQDDGTVLNRVRITKFGVPIAGARVIFFKPPTPAS